MGKIPAARRAFGPGSVARSKIGYGSRWRRLTPFPALVAFAACSGDPSPSLDVTLREVTSPAGEDSGEPFLSASEDGLVMSWLEASPVGGHELRFSRWTEGAWTPAGTIARSDRFFVNWADFPSITLGPSGTLWAHWLERGAAGGYDYGVRVVRSSDDGATWSEPWTPHEDASPTEHGFVSTLPVGDGMGFVWLDGREYAAASDGTPGTREMTLRYRSASAFGAPGAEELVDGRVCDCCQTDAALAASGAVVVYRDRSEDEIRDVYVTRLVAGAWTEGAPVHADGWRIDGCPVNGPAVAARGDEVVVAWFTGAEGVAKVKVARSSDGGASFGPPVPVDDGDPVGRVDVLLVADGSALVTWIERTGEGAAEVRMRRVADGSASESVSLTTSSSERASGFPRMVAAPGGGVVLAWTDVSGEVPRVRVQHLQTGPS